MLDRCRLCDGSINKTSFSVSLNDEIDINVTFKDMIEYYCHIKLDDKSSLSQKVCFVCKSMIENFIKFCDITDNIQLKLKAVKNDTNFQKMWIVENHDSTKIDEDSDEQIKQEDPVISNVIKIRRKRGRVNNIYNKNIIQKF